MVSFEEFINKKNKVAVVGLGYVGLPLAVAFAKKIPTIGYDCNEEKINNYIKGIDVTKELGNRAIIESGVEFSAKEKKLAEADFFIVAVPTPIKEDKTPDLSAVLSATRLVGRNMKKDAVVVYESTVYPGVTEDECLPILEKESNMICGRDFKIGYSPERINPSDKKHTLATITKIVSGFDQESLEFISKMYQLVALKGVYCAESIKVAEAAKVIENSQRDINIAFMNELSIIFHKMGIDTKKVLEAAMTKWNFLPFSPGLVGGHCIGVDPYYLTHIAEKEGYHSQIILSGRRINDSMGKYIAESLVKALIKNKKDISKCEVLLIGFAFKENCQDTRNTKVIDIVNELKEYGIKVRIVDEVADKDEAEKLYGVEVENNINIRADAVVLSVKHCVYEKLKISDFDKMYKDDTKILFDVKGIYDKKQFEDAGYYYWRL